MNSIPQFELTVVTPWGQKVTIKRNALSPLLKMAFALKWSHWTITRGTVFLLAATA